ncbi:outer membrane beta-barrel protein [Cytophagaceae bacterium ABcell3]|nr:outer membrane beta-barrel protein [Cytophagaceae bacterium ABcell3]
MLFRNSLFIILTFISLHVTAQTHLEGVVVDESFDFPLTGAWVKLISLPDSTKKATYTDDEGSFSFKSVKPGVYALQITSLGYYELNKKVEVSKEPLLLDTLKMQGEDLLLDEINIEGEIPPVTQNGDTSQFNAESFKVNPDANVEDLIKKMPGVVMENGKLKVQGEDVKMIFVDGKPFFGDDPSVVLKNLPADAVSKIQVYDRQSEQAQFTGFDDGETSKTINIITKPDMRNGKFGRVYGGYGTDSRYKAGGNINAFNGDQRISVIGQTNNINIQNFSSEDLEGIGGEGGNRRRGRRRQGAGSDISDFQIGTQDGIAQTSALGINYSDKWGKKTEVTGSYFFNRSNIVTDHRLNRSYVLSDSIQRYRENSLSLTRNIDHRLNFRIEHKIDSMNSFLILPRVTLHQNDGNSELNGENRLNGIMLNETGNIFNTDLMGYNLANDILYKRRFSKEGRTLSMNLHTGYNRNHGENFLNAGNIFYHNGLIADTIDQYAELITNGANISATTAYTEPLGKNGQLKLDHRFTWQDNISDRRTFQYSLPEMGYTVIDTALSNIFNSNYVSQRVGGGYRYQKDKLRFNIKLRYEWAQLNGEREFPNPGTFTRNFSNLLPSAMLRYDFSKTKNLRVFYRTYTRVPNVEQLQNVIHNNNPLKLYSGNADLVQEYRNRIFVRYSASQPEKGANFFTYVSGTFINNFISNSTYIAGQDTMLAEGILLQRGAQLTRPVNLDGYYSLHSFSSYSFPVKVIKSNLGLNFRAGHTRRPGLINNLLNYSYNNNFGLGFTLGSNISQNLDFTIASNTNFNFVENTLRSDLNTSFISQSTQFSFNWIFWKGLVCRTTINHQLYSGLAEGFNQSFFLWNMSIGKKIFNNQRGEVTLSVYDLLGQNNNIQRVVTEAYVEDVMTNVLQRYIMLNFTYNLRSFKSMAQQLPEEN